MLDGKFDGHLSGIGGTANGFPMVSSGSTKIGDESLIFHHQNAIVQRAHAARIGFANRISTHVPSSCIFKVPSI